MTFSILGVFCIVLVLAGVLYTWLVLALIVPSAVASCLVLLRATPDELDRETVAFDLVILLFAAVWVLFNAFFAAQHLFVERDPGFYANGAVWVMDNPDLNLQFEDPLNQTAIDSPGFNQGPDRQYIQGTHTFPATLGLIGRFTGLEGLFRATTIFGGLALLAVYSFARQTCRAKWAFLSTATLSVLLPFVYFSRDTYTEPMTIMATFSGLSLMALAYRQKTGWPVWFLGGTCMAIAVALRIDGLLLLAPVVGALAIMIVKMTWGKLAAFSLPVIAGVALLWFDVSQASRFYYTGHRHQMAGLVFLAVVALILGAALAIDRKTVGVFVRFYHWGQSNVSNYMIAVVLAVVGIVFASRPLWFTHEGPQIDPKLEGQRRLYGEVTIDWLVIYLGPLAALLAAVGFVVVAVRLFRGSRLDLLPWFFAFAVTAALYLNIPNITPDQVWASRRFLPMIFPSLAVFVGVALDFGEHKLVRVISTPRLTTNFVVAFLAVIVFPVGLTNPFLTTPNHENLATVKQVCAELDRHDDPVVVWYGVSRAYLAFPTLTVCGHESTTFGRLPATKDGLTTMMEGFDNENRTAIVAVLESDMPTIPGWEDAGFSPVADIEVVDVEKTFEKRPIETSVWQNRVMFAQIMPDGTLKRL